MRNAFYMMKVNRLKIELLKDEKVQQIPQHIKQKIADEILVTLKAVNANADATLLQGDCAFNFCRLINCAILVFLPAFLKLLLGKTSWLFILKPVLVVDF